MSGARSYALAELVAATGFDRRTIVYYIQSGLLPKVGRRGPHTRYPEDCLTRLLFIQGVKTLQTEGKLLTATLAEIRRALGAVDAAGIGELLSRGLPVDALTVLFAELPEPVQTAPQPTTAPEAQNVAAPPTSMEPARAPAGERRSYGLADAGIRKRFGVEKPPAPVPAETHHDETHPGLPVLTPAPSAPASAATPAGSGVDAAAADPDLGELLRELEVRPTLNARRSPPGAPEQWTEIPITSRVYLSVRGLAEDDVPLAEAVARLLKRALRTRSTSTAP
ncbi:MAG: MerR family transcriptional regulator [Gammaproteobacteria bacterium]|nr:MerR family transcriptional regulator [Gammaproteobacteria bacterium]